ncbi:macro domain-containing protein [Macrococcoides caseolyticum]|uniref:macro domain-containing protein n=1 Tax=Macrococcoides caseolyticum TaxID=69966 RepID=UPI000C327EF5|nr:macro domain-containing protein [Macrococcus caseolyticus]PKE62176.1 hypothetical protein CW683_11760 [Macrococcus caseolyticus]PKF44354.1 hypothetical protein CW664_11325 [Macrococcus caseolyticus]
MINYTTGDIFNANTEIIVNTVNCEGVMGKGLAYQFKKRYPEMVKDYQQFCKDGHLRPGKVHYYEQSTPKIINFPTKDKWRQKSKISYIEDGLDALVDVLVSNNVKSIAIPPLGAGNGGLSWIEVKKVIESKLNHLSNEIEIKVYEPTSNITSLESTPDVNVEHLTLLYIATHIKDYKEHEINKIVAITNEIYEVNLFKSNLKELFNAIKKLKKYYNTNDNNTLYKVIYDRLISKTSESTLNKKIQMINTAIEVYRKLDGNINEFTNRISVIKESNAVYHANALDDFILELPMFQMNIFDEIEYHK